MRKFVAYRNACAASAALLVAVSCWATDTKVVRVPEDQPTLAQALAAAPQGATIMVAAGEWDARGIAIAGRNISIVGAGPGRTTLSGGQAAQVFRVTDASELLLEGLTIRDGYAPEVDGGGALFVDSAECTIRSCTFIANRGRLGGAIFLQGSGRVAVSRSVFEGNAAIHVPYGDAGAIFAHGASQLSVESSLFRHNTAPYHGGAITTLAAARFHNCIFDGNGAAYGGAARTYAAGNTLTFSHCTFVDNVGAYGTTIYCYYGTVRLINCALRGTGPMLETTHDGRFFGSGSVISSGTVPGYSNITADPQIAADYSLLASSPCIDVGIGQMLATAELWGPDFDACALIATDYAGAHRWNDVLTRPNASCHRAWLAPDAGAVEFAGAAMSPLMKVDANNDGALNALDLAAVLAAWGVGDCDADLTVDGVVDGSDLSMLLSVWGTCQG